MKTCECCHSPIVWQHEGVWNCFYCDDVRNNTSWKCPKTHPNHPSTQLTETTKLSSSSSLSALPSTTTPMLPTQLGDGTASLENFSSKVIAKDEVFHPTSNLTSLGSGDSILYTNFLTKDEADAIFATLGDQSGKGEIEYQQWYHMVDKRKPLAPLEPLRRIKRALCNPNKQGLIPLYRFPVNDQERYGELIPMTPTIDKVRKMVEARLGVPDNTFNHAVILLYSTCDDCIGFHKDKTLDLDDSMPIVSVSLGLARPYVLRDSILTPTHQQSFELPHGALLVLGPESNQNYYHSVRQLSKEEMEQAIAKSGTSVRVSLTFRAVSTYRDHHAVVSGKGAEYQTLNWPTELKGEHRMDQQLTQPIQPNKEMIEAAAKAEQEKEDQRNAHLAEVEKRQALKARREPLQAKRILEEVERAMDSEEIKALLAASTSTTTTTQLSSSSSSTESDLKRAKTLLLDQVTQLLLKELHAKEEEEGEEEEEGKEKEIRANAVKQIEKTVGRCLGHRFRPIKTN